MSGRSRVVAGLGVGSVISGLLAYVFFAVVTRALGSTAAAPVSVLWTYWSFSAAAITFPVQHWISRATAAGGGDLTVRRALPAITAGVAGIAVGAGALAWVLRADLFHRSDPVFPLLVTAVTLGSGYVGLVRGVLSARQRFSDVAWALVLENGLRCLLAAGLVSGQIRSPLLFGVALACGPLIGLGWFRSLRVRTPAVTPDPDLTDAGRGSSTSPLRFVRNAAGGSLLGQAVLTGGPVVLALSGGRPATVTALFVALALFRAPYTLAIGLLAPLTGGLTTLVVTGREAELRRVRLGVLAGTAAAIASAAGVGAGLGPTAVRIVFGPGVRLVPVACMLVAVGSAIALATLVMNVTLMARDLSAAVTQMWLVGAAVGAIGFVIAGVVSSDRSGVLRTCWAFVLAEAAAFVFAACRDARAAARAYRPDSADDGALDDLGVDRGEVRIRP